jgi:hypothetical protein
MAEKTKDETFNLDFTGVGPLPTDQRYLATLTKFDPAKASTGKPMATAEFTIDEPEAFKGRKVFRNYILVEQSLPFLYPLLVACGESREKLEVKNFKFNPAKYRGAQVTLWVKTRESDEYGDRSDPSRYAPASAYKEAATF